MPMVPQLLDHLSLYGIREIGDLGQNDRCTPPDRLGTSREEYDEFSKALSDEERDELQKRNYAAHYQNCPLKKFAEHICSLSQAERLEELRNPVSGHRWFYSLSLEHMLHISASPLANHELDVLKAALEGLEHCVALVDKHGAGRWLTIERMSYTFGFYVAVKYILPGLMNWKLNNDVDNELLSTASATGMEDCSICCESLHEGSNLVDDQTNDQYESEWKGELYFVLPDFTKFVWDRELNQDDWDSVMKINADTCTSMENSRHGKKLFEFSTEEKVFSVGRKIFHDWQEKGNGPVKQTTALPPTAKLSCSHSFHRACIKPWLLTKGTCPNCRHVTNKIPLPIHREMDDILEQLAAPEMVVDTEDEEMEDGEILDYDGFSELVVPETIEEMDSGERLDYNGLPELVVPEMIEDMDFGEILDHQGRLFSEILDYGERLDSGERHYGERLDHDDLPEVATPETMVDMGDEELEDGEILNLMTST